jgi:16S rRNA (cytidine1402-2'-O)-methyltransferase
MTAVFYEAPHRIVQTLEEIQAQVGNLSVIVARELTKAHEELVRGPISTVLERGLTALGEFTVIVDIGHITELELVEAPEPPADDVIMAEFGRLTINRINTRRQAIAKLSRKYGISAKEAYRALEDAKKSGS